MLLVPFFTGVCIAVPEGVNWGAVVLLAVGAIALFWLRTPFESWLGTSVIKAHTREERVAAARASLVTAGLATLTLAALFATGSAQGLVMIGSLAVLAFGGQVLIKRWGRQGRMPAQIVGAIGLTATSAAAYYVACARLDRTAVALWIANWLFAANQIQFVQLRIHSSRAATFSEKLRDGAVFLAAEVAVPVAVVVGWRLGLFPALIVFAFVPALFRGTLWFFERRCPLNVTRLGFTELAHAVVFGALLIAAFLTRI